MTTSISAKPSTVAPGIVVGLVLLIMAFVALLSTAYIVLHRRRVGLALHPPLFRPAYNLQSPLADLEKDAITSTPRGPRRLRKLKRKTPPALPADLEKADIFSPQAQAQAHGSPPSRPPVPMPYTASLTRPKMGSASDADTLSLGSPVGAMSFSTLSVDVSPSFPRVYKVETEGGGTVPVELRVTPPTPSMTRGADGEELPMRRSEFSVRRLMFGNFGLGMSATQSEADSKWWHM